MANLKKFNNQTDYKSYIGGSEFSAPDISAIGVSTIPSDLDAEYNPLNMLHVNVKQLLSPTATTLPFIIDTITNGKVGVWWRPSTESTYTKVNPIDLIFNSGFTENKITDLVINTKPVSSDYNNIYIVSAVSDTNVLINDTDICTQYGLITLEGGTFESTGGSINVQLKTAYGNKWEITNIPSWLTFSQTTGEGTTNLIVTASEYTSTTVNRNATVTINYIDIDYTNNSNEFTQKKKEDDDYFSFDEHSVNLPSTATTSRVVTYKASGATIGKTVYFVSSDSTWLTVVGTSTTVSSTGSVIFSTIENPNRSYRTATITARLNSQTGDVIDTITITQEGAGAYFYLGSSVENALSTSATSYTYPSEVGSADTTSKMVYFATNYSASEVGALSINYPSSISNVSVNTSNSSITFNFETRAIVTGNTADTRNATITVGTTTITATQAAPAYFKWNNSSITVGSSAGNGSNTYSSNINYNNISVNKSSEGTFITSGPTMNNTGVTFSVAANTTTEDKTCTITASYNSIILDTFTVIQNGADAYFWTGSMNSTATTSSVESTGQTGCEVQCYSNRTSSYLNSITVSGNSTWISNILWDSSSQKVTFNVDTYDGTESREGIIGIYNSNGTMIGKITVNQGPSAPYFKFDANQSTAYTYNTNTSAATTFEVNISTNYALSDIKTSSSGYFINSYTYSAKTVISVTMLENSTILESTNYIYFYTGNTSTEGRIGVLTIKQDARKYIVITGGGTYETGSTSDSVTFNTNYKESDIITGNYTLDTSGGTWLTISSYSTPLVDGNNYEFNLSENNNTSQRTGYILLKSHGNVVDYVEIIQKGQSLPTYYLYFTDYPSNNTITVTVDSADTNYSEAITYNYPSLTTGKTSNVSSVSYDANNVTANFDENTSRDERTVGVATLQGTGGAGPSITLTLNIKQRGVAQYLTWRDGSTTKSTTKGNNADTYNDLISTNWTSSELNNLTVSSDVSWLTGGTVNTSSASYTVGANPAGSSSRTGTIIWKNGSTTVLTLNVTQNAGESYYFNWSGGTSTASTTNISSATTSAGNNYSTNYPSITFDYSGMTTGVTTGSSSSVTANFTTNPAGSSSRSGWVIAKYGSTTVGTWSLTQNAGESYYFNWSNGSTAQTITVNHIGSATSVTYTTNYTDLTFIEDGVVVTNVTKNGNNSITVTYSSNPSTTTRNGSVTVKYGTTTVGILTINQTPKPTQSLSLRFERFKYNNNTNLDFDIYVNANWYIDSEGYSIGILETTRIDSQVSAVIDLLIDESYESETLETTLDVDFHFITPITTLPSSCKVSFTFFEDGKIIEETKTLGGSESQFTISIPLSFEVDYNYQKTITQIDIVFYQ